MEKDKALELLHLDFSATAQQIRIAYQEMYNELQIRVTNAPTDHQRKLYNRRLKELGEAYEVLGHSSDEDTNELPNIGPVNVELPKKEATGRSEEIKTGALDLLGLQQPYTAALLENAYRKKKRELEKALRESPIESVRTFYSTEIEKLEHGYTHLRPLAKNSSEGNTTGKKSGMRKLIFLFLAMGIIGTGAFFWLSWNQPPELDPDQREQFITFKGQGDLLAGRQEWTEALQKYLRADEILKDREVEDSIASIKSKLLIIEKEKIKKTTLAEENIWEEISGINTLSAYRSYLTVYPEGKYAETAKNKISGIGAGSIKKVKVDNVGLADENNWKEVAGLKTVAAYESYLAKYPKGKYARRAQKEIDLLEEAERIRSSGIQELYGLKDTDGEEFRYKGETKADLPHGTGVANFINGDKYTGDWYKGKRHGDGTHLFSDGTKIVGQWKNDMVHGRAIQYYKNGEVYVSGPFIKGFFVGNSEDP